MVPATVRVGTYRFSALGTCSYGAVLSSPLSFASFLNGTCTFLKHFSYDSVTAGALSHRPSRSSLTRARCTPVSSQRWAAGSHASRQQAALPCAEDPTSRQTLHAALSRTVPTRMPRCIRSRAAAAPPAAVAGKPTAGMARRRLGASDLTVSEVCMGAHPFR